MVVEEDARVRDAGYAERLKKACDASPHCPPARGRLTWISQQFLKRYDEKVSVESVRKWYAGIVKPMRDKNSKLATMLDVDDVWLYLGVNPDMSPRERKVRNAEVDGAVNVIAGFIQMDGGSPAFPEESDALAQRRHIDLYAVIKGASYSFHISLAHKHGDDWRFSLPNVPDMPIVLGVVRDGFSVDVIELTPELVETHGSGTAAARSVTLTEAQVEAGMLTSFAKRL